MILIFVVLFAFAAIFMITWALLPRYLERYENIQEKKASAATRKLDLLFMNVERKQVTAFFTLSPLVFAIIGLILFQHWIGIVVGITIGLALPNLCMKMWDARRKARFNSQLLDGLMMLSSSLKAGLSLLQAMEVVVEDALAPLSQEFGWVVNEIKMGVTLEESLLKLSKRMPSEELTLIVNACLVAKITGGDLTKLFSRLSLTIRQNLRLKEEVKTLTFQGRLQGIVMLILPFVFVWVVFSFNRNHFDIMLSTEIGRILIVAAVFLDIVGIFLIIKFSQLKV
ncbi:MAG: type II secretion system F family protein [Candidatus Omnitrophica bacterium]|nr:type II secretion system F family protein [Candidatus Omnitrophota bacterium]